MADPILAEFTSAAEEFLAGVAEPKPPRTADSWGEGEDRFSLFRGSSIADAKAARDWLRQVFDAGFGWICGPVEWGGRGLPPVYEKAYLAVERNYDVPSRSPLGVSLGMVGPTLAQCGSDGARSRWLKALYRGDAIGCQLFSEPAAGSDLASVATKAVRDGDHWRVSGQKVWTSGAHYSDVGLLLARTSAEPRHKNLTAFLVDMHAPGVEVRPLRQMTGGADFNEVFLDDVRIGDEFRLGDVDEGWRVALATLAHERGAIGGSGAGGSGLFDMKRLAAMLIALGVQREPAVRQAYAALFAGVA
ncbi:MAG: acyl-CoA dehydrogenase family protein, partial [Mycobacterium sp.]